MRKWAIYAGISAIFVGLSALILSFAFDPPARSGIWTGLATAWLVQAVAFAILIAATRRRAKLVLAGWTAGTFLRIASLGLLAWLTLGGVLKLPPEPTLLALVAALFGLLLLEPVIFRHSVETR